MILNVEDKNGIIHNVQIYNCNTLPIQDILRGVTTSRKRSDEYYNIAATFDIETTSICKESINSSGIKTYKESYGFMYHWQFCLGTYVAFGRTWEEFNILARRLQSHTYIAHRKFVVFCHFLGFEFQFMQKFLEVTATFSRKARNPLTVRTPGIEYRCSFYLTNMSLDRWTSNTKSCTFSKKPRASYDYEKIRTPETKMEQGELEYCYCDVRGPAQCITEMLEEDTIASLPLTSTGFVRREFREAVLKNPENAKLVKKTQLNEQSYTLAKKVIRGGNTHASVLHSNIIHDEIDSFDIKSSYPACMLLDKVPVTRFIKVTPSKEKFARWVDSKACMFTFICEDIAIKELHKIPYIDRGHCRNIVKGRFDNGRILSAHRLEMSVTDVDWKIIKSQYKMERCVISEMWIADYGMLPIEFREHLLYYFRQKCELEYKLDELKKRGLEHSEEYINIKYLYNKFKNKINAAYGMMVTDIASPEIVYNDGEWIEEEVNIQSALKRYYSNSNSFLSYQQGVWIVANARRRLQVGLDSVGIGTIYLDTDSIKSFKGYRDVIENINASIRHELETNELDLVVSIGDMKYYIGTWAYEETYDRFKTMGAKKYCYEKNGNAYITVSGINKELGTKELNEYHGGIEGFKEGTIFSRAGHTTHVYNDSDIHTITIDGVNILTASSISVFPSTYKLDITDEYSILLNAIDLNRD